MASSSEPSGKRGREEEDHDESRRRRLVKEGTPLAPEEPEEVPPSPPDEPEEVLAPQLEEVLEPQPMAVSELVQRCFCEASKGVAVYLGVPIPNDPL
jgi:hypothetical protein